MVCLSFPVSISCLVTGKNGTAWTSVFWSVCQSLTAIGGGHIDSYVTYSIRLVATVGFASWSSPAHKTVSCHTRLASPRAEPCAGFVWTPGPVCGPEQAPPVAFRQAAMSANNTEDFPRETLAADMRRVPKSTD